jgi:cytidine deaminase
MRSSLIARLTDSVGRSASVCLHRFPDGRVVVLSPCGVCRERLATHGPELLAAVPAADDATVVAWKRFRKLLPDYWMSAFPDELGPGWSIEAQ